MGSVLHRLEIVRIAAACAGLLGCSGGPEPGESGPDAASATPSLGAGTASLITGDWKVIGAGDFNFDGQADVLWNDPVKNTMAVWLMRGTHLLVPGPAIPGPAGAGWSALTPADFNLDGLSDVPWSNAGTSTMATWLMAGPRLLVPGPEIPGPVGDGWSAVTAADFNLDGSADMLWYNAAKNTMAVWLMAGSKLLLAGPELPAPPGPGWVVDTAADFNLDGMADVLFNNPATNEMTIWLMSGTGVLLPGPVIPGPLGPGWTAVTAADFDADGMADVIWTNSTHGSTAVWLMNGPLPRVLGPEIPGPIGPGWSVAYAADFNFDGLADALWQNASPTRMAVWLMSGTHLLLPGPEIPGPLDPGP